MVENAKVMMSFSHDRNGFNDKGRQKLDDSEISSSIYNLEEESIDPSEKALEKLQPIRTSSYADDSSNKDSDGASTSNIGFSTGGG
ncbi:hypothetical protein JTB14_009251 [Gonioctena quinquepunctata]|nr:hypothetical protein JTB14_009251 [Gonioctena quinquepunctata]